MNSHHILRVFAVGFLSMLTTLRADGQELKQATNARFDLQATDGRLDFYEVVRGEAEVSRMTWLPELQQGSGYTVQFPIRHFGDSSLTLRFTPSRAGRVKLTFMGPWEEQRPGTIFKQEIRWTSFSVKDARIAAGRFEPLTTWHDDPRMAELIVTNKPVTITISARSIRPASSPDMKRLGKNTRAHRAAKRFRKGVNLGNYLEPSPSGTYQSKFSAADARVMQREGFDHVRIPVRWSAYVGPGPGYKIDNRFALKVDQALKWCHEADLNVILNVHHFDEFTSSPDQQLTKLRAIWKQIAQRYGSQPNSVAFELLNEPKDAATTPVMNRIYKTLIEDIRRTQPERTLLVGPGAYNAISQLGDLRLPNDDNLIVSVHCYDPFLFTHQGANWTDGKTQLTGIQFPGPPSSPLRVGRTPVEDWVPNWVKSYNRKSTAENPCSAREFADLIQLAKQWGEYYGRPIHIGEFGAYTKADPSSRARYYGSFRREAEKQNLGWAIWDWAGGFDYWDHATNRPKPGMRRALFGR